MRIAYVSADPGVPVFGRKGCSVHVRAVVDALEREGAEVHVVTSRVGGPVPISRASRVHSLPVNAPAAPAEHDLNQSLTDVLSRLEPLDMVYERYSLWSHAGMTFARARGIPGILEVNAPLIEEHAAHRGPVDRVKATQVAERVWNAASAILAVSDGVASYLTRQGVAPDRIIVTGNGVDADRFGPHVVPHRPRSADRFTIGFVGSLKAWHGLDLFIDAFAQVARRVPARLVIIGDGPARQPVSARVDTFGLQSMVEFVGAVDAEEIPGWLASMDAAVAPYPPMTDFYFSPLKVYEYLAAGLPVVASRIGELATVIQPGVTGMLCEPGDNRAFADALVQLARDPVLRRRMGAAARAQAAASHTWRAVARTILACGTAARPLALSSAEVGQGVRS
jgi:glycosyltransferase involved in cell wall biosynthesis